MLQEQRVLAHALAVGLAQQPVPQLALEAHLRVRLQRRPERVQRQAGAAERHARAAERLRDGARLRREIRPLRQQRLQPSRQLAGAVRVRVVAGQLLQRPVAQGVGDEGRAVRRQPGDRARAARPGGRVRQVVGHPGEHVAFFPPQVALQLDDGGAPHRVDAAAVVEQIHLVGDLLVRRAEAGA